MGRYVTRMWPPGGAHEYGAYVPPPLVGWESSLSRRVRDRIASADADILDALATTTANRSYQWAADSIMAQGESLSSSAIEGIFTSLEGMSMSGGEGGDPSSRAAVGNWEMLEQALGIAESGEPLTVDRLCDLHDTLMAKTPSPQHGGRLRSGPIWIGAPAVSGMGPIGAQFVPPPAEEIRPLLGDLLDYINYSGHSPVLKAAVTHAQFETIHPFPDGNGRIGRALIPIALFGGQGQDAIHLPISRNILADRPRYYAALQHSHWEGPPHDPQRGVALEPWIGMFADCAQEAAEQVRAAAALTERLMEDWLQRLGGTRHDSAVWKIASEIPFQPVFTADTLFAALEGRTSITAIRRGISDLAKANIVKKMGNSGKTQVWRAAEIVEIAEKVLRTSDIDSAASQTHQQIDAGGVAPAAMSGTGKRARSTEKSHRGNAWQCSRKSSRSSNRCVLPVDHEGRHRYE